MKLTLYARITDTTIAEENFRVTAAVEENYCGDELPATTAGAAMNQLAGDHRRLLQRPLQPPRRPRLRL